MKRNENESYFDYAERITRECEAKSISLTQWCELLIGKSIYGEINLRRCQKFMNEFFDSSYGINEDPKLLDMGVSESEQYLLRIERAKEQLDYARKRAQSENIQLNETRRETARADALLERISTAIDKLDPIEFSGVEYKANKNSPTGVLCIADAHYGVEIELKSFFGDVVNVYNPDVFKERMTALMDGVVKDAKLLNYEKLVVFDLGDQIEGILRMSSLRKLRVGVVDSVIEYAEFLANWLIELSERLEVPIEYVCLGGNHDTLRLLNSKPTFEEENMSKVIREFINLRIEKSGNKNIVVDEYADASFKCINGVNILARHGHGAKNDNSEIAFWENYHNISIDVLLGAHMHHSESKTVSSGQNGDREVIKVPSIVGSDTYSKSIRATAKAGARFILFEDAGKTWERNYILN